MSCHRGAVQRLPAGHCRGREGEGVRAAVLPSFPAQLVQGPPCQGPRGPAQGAPQAKHTTLIPDLCICPETDFQDSPVSQMRKWEHRREVVFSAVPSWKEVATRTGTQCVVSDQLRIAVLERGQPAFPSVSPQMTSESVSVYVWG